MFSEIMLYKYCEYMWSMERFLSKDIYDKRVFLNVINVLDFTSSLWETTEVENKVQNDSKR